MLLSYSHDTPEHEQRVLELCNRLRARGIDAFIDQFLPGAPSEGWPLWMERRIECSDFTLMVCTEAYQRRFMEDEAAGVGRGVVWEARILRNLLYEDSGRHGRIVPVLIDAEARQFVPTVFRGHFYDISEERGFEGLVRHLLREPGAEAEALGALGPQGSRWSAFERPWVVPDAMRTRYFTGRETLLASLRTQLVERRRAALCGLGGAGKTQSALEYAVRHRSDYLDGVFWVNAETASARTSGFVEIAKTLGLSAATSSDEEHVVRAVLEWLNGTLSWLLILDNVEDRREIAPLLPQRGDGHVLLTSRESVFGELGIARALEVADLARDESVEFLLRRTGRDDDAGERAAAVELAAELGHLPLALAQAGAYVAETGSAFADYLAAFRKRRLRLLEKGGGLVAHDGVAVTWAANFEAVERASPAAADVLRISAFLAPDAIPFELFETGAASLGEPIAEAVSDADELAMAELLRPLARYSLVRLDAKARTYGVHRLVQEIVRASIAESERRSAVERTAGALESTFPPPDYATFAECDRLVSHVTAIGAWSADYGIDSLEAARALKRASGYLWLRGRYFEAQPLAERALAIFERTLGNDSPELARTLNDLGNIHAVQQRNAPALTLYERALEIRERVLGADHPDVGASLNNLANVYFRQGRYADAAEMQVRAVAIKERAHGADHPIVAGSLNNLAEAYGHMGRYADALPLHERAARIRESALGEHPDLAESLYNFASTLVNLGRYDEALRMHERALAMNERTLGPEHPEVAYNLLGSAQVLSIYGREDEAVALLERAVEIRLKVHGPEHPELASCLLVLGNVHRKCGRFAEAEAYYVRAHGILDRAAGQEHPDFSGALVALAELRKEQGRDPEALTLLERALVLTERTSAGGPAALEALRAGIESLRAKVANRED